MVEVQGCARGIWPRVLAAVVLLHATGGAALDWWWVLAALARTHRVYAPDLPCPARAAVQTTDRVNDQEVTTQVAEQFVLRNEDGAWRIDQVACL
jgi:pimeloyl-ACP methyl ester carboxylesterase